MKRCPFCAEKIQDKAVICRYCGKQLSAPPVIGQPPVLPPIIPGAITKSNNSGRRKVLPWIILGGVIFLVLILVIVISVTSKPRIVSTEGMVYIPGGTFQMGMDADDALAECQKFRLDCEREWFTDLEPVHTVRLSPYWIDSTEVTIAQYRQCCYARECSGPRYGWSETRPDYFSVGSYENYPVIYVTWDDAKDYCEWMGKRLPTEAEWEFAARGTDGRIFPWGDTEPNCSMANYLGCVGDTEAVGKIENLGSPYDVFDMAGNVKEWVADWYGPYSSNSQIDPQGPTTGDLHITRGGSWETSEIHLLTIFRESHPSYYMSWLDYQDVGFRCVMTP